MDHAIYAYCPWLDRPESDTTRFHDGWLRVSPIESREDAEKRLARLLRNRNTFVHPRGFKIAAA